jgi:YD repeat-containing protein
VASITDAVKSLRTLTYHPTFNKVTSITDPLRNLTTFDYDPQGNLVAITDPRGRTAWRGDDRTESLTQTTDPLGHATRVAYNNERQPFASPDMYRIGSRTSHGIDQR